MKRPKGALYVVFALLFAFVFANGCDSRRGDEQPVGTRHDTSKPTDSEMDVAERERAQLEEECFGGDLEACDQLGH